MDDYNIDKLQFVTLDAIDKVVASGIQIRNNPGPSGPSYAGSDRMDEWSIPNPYGKKCLVRYRWKTEDSDYNSPQTEVQYAFTVDATSMGGPISDPIPGTKAAVAVGVSDTEIYFRTLNGHHSDVIYTAGPDLYTGYGHVFTIEYALFEIL